MKTVLIDADYTYELAVTYFDPGSPGTWGFDDGHAAEVEFGSFVKVWLDPKTTDVATFETFVLNYASTYEIPLTLALQRIEEEAVETLTQEMIDDYESSKEAFRE